MKRTLLVTLSALTLSLIATPAFAEKFTTAKSSEISPVNLVTRAYQGHFTNQGIPSSAVFSKSAATGRITATDLVEVAIAKGRLSPDTINDTAYISTVQSYLDSLDND